MRFGALPVTLRQLQYACAVAEEKSFRKAAERCHVSQPTLSAQVAELERVLDVALFERGSRGVRTTRAGEELVARARQVLLAADSFLETAARHVDPLAGTLRVGVIPTVGPYLLPDLDPALRRAFPGLELRWTEDKTDALVRMIQDGTLDAAVLALESEIGDLEHAPVGVDPFVLAAPPGHALARGKPAVGVDALASQHVLLLDDGHCFRDQALDLCTRAGAEEQGFRATSLSTLVQMTAGGEAVTILPRMAVEVENRRAGLVVRPFQAPGPSRTLVLAWRKASPLGAAFVSLAEAARRAFEDAAGERSRTSPSAS